MPIVKRLSLIAVIAFCALAGGCWDARDINDRNIATAIVVDKTDYGYAFIAEIATITGGGKAESETSQTKMTIAQSEGRTLSEARENIDKHMDKPLFLGAVQTIILTDRLARYDIEEYLLRLRQLNEYRKTVHVTVTTTEPLELLSSKPENSQSIGFAVDSTVMSLVNIGELHDVSLMDVLEKLASPYPHYTLPTIAIINGDPEFTGYSVFSGGMKTGFIPASESHAIVFLRSTNTKFEYVVPYKNTQATVQVQASKKKIKPKLQESGIEFELDMSFKGTLLYLEKDKPISEGDMQLMQATLKGMLEQELMETYRNSVETYHCDCFGFNEVFRIHYPEAYERMNWADEFSKTSLALTVNVELVQTSLIDYSSTR